MFRRRTFAVVVAVMILTLGAAPMASAATSATGINVIVPGGGKITGVVKAKDTLAAIASVMVTATPVTGGGSVSTTANTAGAFTLIGLTSGLPYILQVEGDATHPGGYYTSANTDHFTQQPASALPTPAATAAGVSVGTILVAKGFTISGTVKGGTTASSVALAGVQVALSGQVQDMAVSTATGAFSFPGLPFGTYQLSFSAPASANYVSGVYQANSTGNWALALPSSITLNTANASVGVILPVGKTVTGVLKNPAGVAIPNASVQFEPVGYYGQALEATTNAAGTYVFRGVAAYTTGLVHVDPYNGSNLSGYYRAGSTGNFIANSYGIGGTAINVGTANVTVPEIRAGAPVTVTGYVKTTAGAGVPYASVGGADDYTSTDATGKYVLRMGPSSGAICAAADGNLQQGCFREGVTGYFTSVVDYASNVLAIVSRTVPDLKLPAGATISGVVQLPNGTVASGASVTATRACGGGWCESGYGSTNASGAFSITGLWPGTYTVSVRAPYGSGAVGGWFDAGTATTRLSLLSANADTKVLAAATAWPVGTMRLMAGYSISGIVKAGTAASSVALAGASVVASPVSVYVYGASATGTPATGSAAPTGDTPATVRSIALPKDEAKATPSGAVPAASSGSATTSATGAYTISGLEPGWYSIRVTPTTAQNYERGFRMAGVAPNFTRESGLAQLVCVGPACP